MPFRATSCSTASFRPQAARDTGSRGDESGAWRSCPSWSQDGIYQTYDPEQPGIAPRTGAVPAPPCLPSTAAQRSQGRPRKRRDQLRDAGGKEHRRRPARWERKSSYISGHAGTSRTILVIEVPARESLDGTPRHDGRRGLQRSTAPTGAAISAASTSASATVRSASSATPFWPEPSATWPTRHIQDVPGRGRGGLGKQGDSPPAGLISPAPRSTASRPRRGRITCRWR